MIDHHREELVPLPKVPKLLPRRPNGKRLHISTVYRWAQRGVRDGIRLETLRIGGTTYTSRQALQRFAEALSSSDGDTATMDHDPPTVHHRPPGTAARRRSSAVAAKKQVDRIFMTERRSD